MKTKLLKELRRNFVLNKRGNNFQIEWKCWFGGFVSDWMGYKEVIYNRRQWILSEARRYYSKPKQIIN